MRDVTNFVILFLIVKLLSLFLFFSTYSYSCELKEKLVSLSGPMSYLLQELDLAKDPKLLAVSSFHHFIQKDFKGKRLAGGIYLSLKEFSKIQKEHILFMDDGLEMRRNGKKIQEKTKLTKEIRFVDSRGEDAFTFSKQMLTTLKGLTLNCSFDVVEKKIKLTQRKLASFNFHHKNYLFFLGEISSHRSKNLLMNNDGFVTSFRTNKTFKSIKSTLKYFSPSQKEMNKIEGPLSFGLRSSQNKKLKIETKDKNVFLLSRAGLLTPGLSQVEFMSEFLDFLSDEK